MFVVAVVALCSFFVWSTNPVHGVLTLVGVGLAFSGALLEAKLEFPALLVVLVYVGAVTVLFIFVVIIVNLRAAPASYVTAESYSVWFVLVGILASGLVSPWGLIKDSVLQGIFLEQEHNLIGLGVLLYGTTRLLDVLTVAMVLFVAIVAAICLSLVGGENYRTQNFYSQIRRSNAVFRFQVRFFRKSNKKKQV